MLKEKKKIIALRIVWLVIMLIVITAAILSGVYLFRYGLEHELGILFLVLFILSVIFGILSIFISICSFNLSCQTFSYQQQEFVIYAGFLNCYIKADGKKVAKWNEFYDLALNNPGVLVLLIFSILIFPVFLAILKNYVDFKTFYEPIFVPEENRNLTVRTVMAYSMPNKTNIYAQIFRNNRILFKIEDSLKKSV